MLSDDFEFLSIAAIESVAAALAELREHDLDMFAWFAPLLKRIEWDYSATNEGTSYDFSPESGVLRVVFTSRTMNQPPEEAVRFALGRAYSGVEE